MNWAAATCWALLLAAAFLCDGSAAKGGRGGARGSARGGRGASRVRVRPAPPLWRPGLLPCAWLRRGRLRGQPRAWRRERAGGGRRGPGSTTWRATRSGCLVATGLAGASTATERGLRAQGPGRASACSWAVPSAPWGCYSP
ncbi:shadow of prion protein precursor, partial [Daubentonia madagascariensis]